MMVAHRALRNSFMLDNGLVLGGIGGEATPTSEFRQWKIIRNNSPASRQVE
jgi:hypothetical protein